MRREKKRKKNQKHATVDREKMEFINGLAVATALINITSYFDAMDRLQ